MYGTGFVSHLTGLMRGKRRLAPDPAPVLLGLAGFDGKLKFLNPAWERILGYPAKDQKELTSQFELRQDRGLNGP